LRENDWRIGPTPARWHPATLVGVVDGDTIKVKWDTQVTSVRMLNINTPERGQPGYREATEHLMAMLGNASAVMLEFEEDGVRARDGFGRLLCHVWLNGKNLSVEQVRAGYSVFWTKYGAGKYPTEFRAAMRKAQGAPVPKAP
jgi:endonuclease YncB( thermonuclease family)